MLESSGHLPTMTWALFADQRAFTDRIAIVSEAALYELCMLRIFLDASKEVTPTLRKRCRDNKTKRNPGKQHSLAIVSLTMVIRS